MSKTPINKYSSLKFKDHMELYALKCDRDRRADFVRRVQMENLDLKHKQKDKETVLLMTQEEVRNLKAKLLSRDERIEHLEERLLHFEQNCNIPIKYVQQHKIKKRKKNDEN